MDVTAIAALVVVLVLAVIIVKLAVIYWVYRAYIKKKPDLRFKLPSNIIVTPTLPINDQQNNRFTPPNSIVPYGTSHEKRFSLRQVATMTNNFEIELGKGGFGRVYYGKMTDGKAVAVKRLSAESQQGSLEFQNEVDILLRVHHRNLVSLIGYCNESQERILIYEYVEEGALDHHLQRLENSASKLSLGWETRIRIAVDAANGLKYLHTDCYPKIIHRDVKASNILLDGKLTAKVADFGLSKSFPQQSLPHVTTEVKGTIGYLDPEYANGFGRLSDKSDVYSFGVVLLELLSGCRHILATPSGWQNISDWARPYILGNKVNEIVDKSFEDDCNMEALNAVALVALKCVEPKGLARPFMSEVLEKLELIAKTYLKPRATLETMEFGVSSQMDSLESSTSTSSETHTQMTRPLIWDVQGPTS